MPSLAVYCGHSMIGFMTVQVVLDFGRTAYSGQLKLGQSSTCLRHVPETWGSYIHSQHFASILVLKPVLLVNLFMISSR
jgi:hypothetical protein